MGRQRPRSGNAQLLLLLTSAIASCGRTGLDEDAFRGGEAAVDAASDVGRGVTDAAVDMPDVRDAAVQRDATPDVVAVPDVATPPDVGVPVSARRPFRVGSSFRSAAAVQSAAWASPHGSARPALPRETAQRLAEAWLADALDEHASIAAFARLTLSLLSVGAPRELVAGGQRASLDEVRHATLSFDLAARYGDCVRGPGPLSLRDVVVEATLVEIAALAAEERCVGETLGAALAAAQLAAATDPAVVAAMRRIAADEARHAEHAWRLLRWAVLQGGAEVRVAAASRIERATREAMDMKLRPTPGDIDLWHAHGRLTCVEAREIVRAVARDVIEPCTRAALAEGAAGSPICISSKG